ncbi:MAG TPA: MFS transporter [Dehalococcoidia bacterium]|nr:MFS transporter [Dehalococcoidia bacterium]
MDLLARIRDEMAFEANVKKSYLYRFLMELQLWLPIWVIYLRDQRGFSLTQINLLDTPFFLLIVLAEVPTGAVADRFGRKTSLMLGSGFFAIAVFVFGIADNYAIILVSYVAWGLALTFQSGADSALLFDSLKQAGREDDFQRVTSRLWALRSVAALVAILIGAPIAEATSFTFVISLSAVIALCALPVAFFMHEPRHTLEAQPEAYFQTLFTGMRDAWKTPTLRYIILFSGIVSMGAFAPMVFEQPFLDEHGISVGNLGLWQAPVRGAGIATALLTGWFISRLGERGAFFAMPVLLGIAGLALAGIDRSWIFMAFLGMGAVAGMQNPVLARYVNLRIPSERRATMLSVQSVAASIALSCQPVGGFIADTWGLQAAFLMYAILTLVGGLGVLLLWDRAERRDVARGETGDGLHERRSEAVPV